VDTAKVTVMTNNAFLLINWFCTAVYYSLFFIAIRQLVIGVLALYEWYGWRRIQYLSDYLPPVSVVVPAFNEEKVICRTIHSLLRSDYSNFNIIVVDDGSTDDTYQCVVEAFRHNQCVHVFTKDNGGKAEALNYGINQTNAEIIVAVDADTLVCSNAIRLLVHHFADPYVGAIAGNTKVGNRINLLTYWQALEYITHHNLERRAFNLLNYICVVPGAIGAWRRQLILHAGGFKNMLAEDNDLTLTILRMGYKVNYEKDAIGLTEAPDTLSGLLKQRFRWIYGSLQSFWKHRDTLFRPRYRGLGMFAIPYKIFCDIFLPLVLPLTDIVVLLSLAWEVWQLHQEPAEYSTNAPQLVLFSYIFLLAVDFLVSLIALMLDKEDWQLLVWLFPQRYFFRYMNYNMIFKSIITRLQSKIVGWGKLERKATVRNIENSSS
jgi:cellulose synthase/poly-beta-1,6-N-acetylglucosamine synthase-like glycosyltransferase